MPRQGNIGAIMEGLMGPSKTRKRGCSSSSSSSSRVYHYRLSKRAILVGKNRVGSGRSRSNTPVPTWRTTPLRSAIVDSPKYSQSGKSARPVSARRLAATLWEMNETPSPEMGECNSVVMKKNGGSKMSLKREKMRAGWGLHSGSGLLPPHLSDPPHSPTLSEKTVRSGRDSRLKRTLSISHRLMSTDQNVGVLDSISNASFMEIEAPSRPPTSTGSGINCTNRLKDVTNALTTSKELLKIISRVWARVDQPSSTMSLISALHTELERARLHVNHLIQSQPSDQNELNHLMKRFVEEKEKWKIKERQLETLNKKLGKELAEIKSSFVIVVRELESVKRAREMAEEVCDELARNVDEDKAEVAREREMLELADKWREERVQMKLSEARHQFEEKNSAISKLRKQLEVFLGARREKDEERERDDGEVEDDVEIGDDSVESDLHSIELDMESSINNPKGYKLGYNSTLDRKSTKLPVNNNEIKSRNSISGQGFRKSIISLQRSVSDVANHSPWKKEQSWPSRDPCGALPERYSGIHTTRLKSRTGDLRGEGQSTRRSKW